MYELFDADSRACIGLNAARPRIGFWAMRSTVSGCDMRLQNVHVLVLTLIICRGSIYTPSMISGIGRGLTHARAMVIKSRIGGLVKVWSPDFALCGFGGLGTLNPKPSYPKQGWGVRSRVRGLRPPLNYHSPRS